MVNVPLGDIAALRVNYSHIDNDGVIDYVNAYQLNEFRDPWSTSTATVSTLARHLTRKYCSTRLVSRPSKMPTPSRLTMRASLRVEPSDTFWGQLTWHFQEARSAPPCTTLGDNNQAGNAGLFFQYGDDDSGQVLLEPSEREANLAALDLEWDMGFATFTSTTSVYDDEGMGDADNGGLWASGGEVDVADSRDWNYLFYGGAWPRPAQRAERGYTDEVLTQEFRLVSNSGDSAFDWIAGAFYMDQDNNVYH